MLYPEVYFVEYGIEVIYKSPHFWILRSFTLLLIALRRSSSCAAAAIVLVVRIVGSGGTKHL